MKIEFTVMYCDIWEDEKNAIAKGTFTTREEANECIFNLQQENENIHAWYVRKDTY